MTRVLYCIFIFASLTLTMSRIRKLTDKGRELLAWNMRGKCASSFRSGNAVINKLVPLLKDNTSSVEQVTDCITNLEHHMSSIVQSYSEFNEKFAGDLDTLADFHKWFNPRYDALQSVLQYSRDWIQNVHFQEGVDKDIFALNVPDFQDDHDDIQPEDSASQVSRQPESGCSSNKTSGSRGSSVRSAHVQESLKKVALMAQVNSLKQKQELMRRELELTMQKETLELTTNLAIATAKEEVLLDVELGREFSVLSHDKTHQVSLPVSQSERPAATSPYVYVDHVRLSVPSNLTSTSVRPAVTVNIVRSQIDGGGPAIVVGQDVNISSSDLSLRQSVLGQLSDAQSVSHTDPKTVTCSVPDIVSDRVSVATLHFADGMSTQSRRSDAGEFTGGSQQRSDDLGHHGVSTTPSPCHGTRMTSHCRGGPAIVVGQDVNISSSDLSLRQSVLGQLSDAQSVSHTDPKTVTRSVPDIVSDRVSVAKSHFADGMSTQSRRSDAGEFIGGSQQRSEDLGHHGVSTTPSPSLGTRMTVAFDDNVAQVHTHTLTHTTVIVSLRSVQLQLHYLLDRHQHPLIHVMV